jgi:hypothetical protein
MRVSDDEYVMLQSLCDARGLTASDILRTSIREAFAKFAKEIGVSNAKGLEIARERLMPKTKTKKPSSTGARLSSRRPRSTR